MSLTDLWLCFHLTCMSACFKAPLALIVLQSQGSFHTAALAVRVNPSIMNFNYIKSSTTEQRENGAIAMKSANTFGFSAL